MSMGARKYLSFREATGCEELSILLKLRHRFDAGSGYTPREPCNELGFHLDSYDLKSWHFGLFEETAQWSRPIGYLRVVENHGIADWRMLKLAEQHHADFPNLDNEPEPLPLMEYWPQGPALRSAYERHAGLHGRIVEATRLCLIPECRSEGITRFLIESALASFFYAYGVAAAFMATSAMNRAYYERIGFSLVEGTDDARIDPAGYWMTCMVATPDNVDPSLRGRIREQSRQYIEERRVTIEETERLVPATPGSPISGTGK